ncbi:MAG: hypothetical protein IT352_13430 [Gemmatimonadales bacterium]|nr:hypothetical protein [Gemmatimonadales bacterium]
MAVKLTSRQQATLAVLETFPSRFDMIHRSIEELASLKADESVARRLARTLDEMKIGAQGVGESGLADSLGVMATLARRTGGLQTRVRGLREGFVSLKINFEGALKAATTPVEEVDEEDPAKPA